MKSFAKLFLVALAVTLIASLFAVNVAAADYVDPNTLTPGSDNVIFIKDAERDPETKKIIGELPGDGTGCDADNPLIPIDHESFDPTATNPKYHLTTAFYQATELLKTEGGTIVICGPVYFGTFESYGSGASTRDVFSAKFGTNTIKITSVYNGVDYRETAGAKIIIESPAEIGMYGQSIWENVDIETASTGRIISFSCYPTLIGEGVNCYPSDPAFEGVAGNHVSLSAGHRYEKSLDMNPTLVVKSGTYNIITGATWGVVDSQTNENANVYLTLEGTTKVYGKIIGTTGQKCKFSGNVNITINGGMYECDIITVGSTGMLNADGKAVLKINGGDFTNTWSISKHSENIANNAPAISTLDFSGWTGELSGLAAAHGAVLDYESNDIKFPEGVTVEQLADALANATTAAPVTEAVVETKAPETEKVEATEAEATEKQEEPNETELPETEAQATEAVENNNDSSSGGISVGLLVAIIVGVVIVAGAVGFLVGKGKKK